MQQIIIDYSIKVVNYTTNENFPSYKDSGNISPLKTNIIVNHLENYNISQNITVIQPNTSITLDNIKYLYLKVVGEVGDISINNSLTCSEFLFNSLTNQLNQDFTITNKDLINPIKIEYYCLSI